MGCHTVQCMGQMVHQMPIRLDWKHWTKKSKDNEKHEPKSKCCKKKPRNKKRNKNNVGTHKNNNDDDEIVLPEEARPVSCDFGTVIDILERRMKMVEDGIMKYDE